jgi:hypothetical protein
MYTRFLGYGSSLKNGLEISTGLHVLVKRDGIL